MKKVLSLALVLMLLCLCCAACGEKPKETEPAPTPVRQEEPEMIVSISDMYTPTELYEATWTVSRYFATSLPGCVVTELEYNEEYSMTRRGALKEKYENPDVLVVRATFTTGEQGEEGLTPNTTYTDVDFILTMAEDGRTWIVEGFELP